MPKPLEHLFTYKITDAEAEFLQPGMRVAVPFGKSKIYTALVFEIHQNKPTLQEDVFLYSLHLLHFDAPLFYVPNYSCFQYNNSHHYISICKHKLSLNRLSYINNSKNIVFLKFILHNFSVFSLNNYVRRASCSLIEPSRNAANSILQILTLRYPLRGRICFSLLLNLSKQKENNQKVNISTYKNFTLITETKIYFLNKPVNIE